MSVTTADAAAASTMPQPAPAGAGGPLRWRGGRTPLVVIGLGNLALSIVTLGIYRFWGAVRLRRYLWAHQEFVGARLEYTGTGGELFRGFLKAMLVVVPLLLLNWLVEPLLPPYSAIAWGFFVVKLAVFTYMVGVARHAARRYIASRTLWRGLRLMLSGSPWRFGSVSLGWTVLTLLSLGLAYPFAVAAETRWMLDRLHLGSEPFRFDGSARALLRPWLASWAFVIVSGLALWLLFGSGMAAAIIAHLPPDTDEAAARSARMLLNLTVAAALALPLMLLAWCAWSATVMRWQAEHTLISGARFAMPSATGGAIFRLVFGNLLITTLSLGLLHPATLARNAAFRARHLRIDRVPDLSAARQAERGPGTGEGLADLLGTGAFGA